MIDLFRAQPPDLHPTAALRAAMRDVLATLSDKEWELESQRQQLVLGAPELRGRMLDQLYATIDLLAELAAERVHRPPTDLAVRAWAGAVVGVVMATYELTPTLSLPESLHLMDQTFTHLEQGLPLDK